MMGPDDVSVLTFCEEDTGRNRLSSKGRVPSPEATPSPLHPALPFPAQEHMTAGGNCQTFSSSTVISYSNTGDGAPKVYQETSEMRSAPGGVSWRAVATQREWGVGGLNHAHREPGGIFQGLVEGSLAGPVWGWLG